MEVSEKQSEVSDENSKDFEDDGEDLPDNFFDDFSNQDFMDGLNVVDDWNDEDDSNDINQEENVKKTTDSNKKPEHSLRQKKEHITTNKKRGKEYLRRRSRSRNRNFHQRSSEHREKRETSIDHRRDPEKTKRDIQRDKLRCAKDHDAKVFQEQLKIAETGLVPPGTELDVVLSTEKFKENETTKENSKEKQLPKEKVIEHKDDSLRKTHKPSISKSHRTRTYLRSISREKSYSPKRRKRNSYSRERDLRYREMPETDLRFRLRGKRERYTARSPRRRFSRSPSPFQSPTSAISEREIWLRNQDRRRNSRSMSPINTSRIRSSSPKKKKFSFMEELEIKLRQKPIRDINAFNIQPQPTIIPPTEYFQPQMQFPPQQPLYLGPPQMCPPPDQFQQQILMNPEHNIIPMPNLLPYANPQPMFMHGLGPYNPPEPVPPPQMFIDHNQMQNQFHNQPLQVNVGQNNENKDLTKLFEDKKISLSDFLSVSAKPIDSTAPTDLHNKIKVISRCQEAIKLLEDPTLIGRFIPRIAQLDSEKKTGEAKNSFQSPLRKSVAVRFNFTIPLSKRWTSKTIEQHSTMTTIHKLMNLLGLGEQINLLSPVSSESSNTKIQEIPDAPPAPKIPRIIKTSNSSAQTEPVTCQICEIRNATKVSDSQTQTKDKKTCDMSTQVSVEDLTKSCTTFIPRGILKSNTSSLSISHLTPAQLLAQLGTDKKDDYKKETFPAYGRNYSDSQMMNPNNPSVEPNLYNPQIKPLFGNNMPQGITYQGRGFVNDNRGNLNQGRQFNDQQNQSHWTQGRGNMQRFGNQHDNYFNNRR